MINLTLNQAINFRDEALETNTEESNVIASILSQLIPHLELKVVPKPKVEPKVVQMQVMGAEMPQYTVLKSDGTMWRQKWGHKWEQLTTP